MLVSTCKKILNVCCWYNNDTDTINQERLETKLKDLPLSDPAHEFISLLQDISNQKKGMSEVANFCFKLGIEPCETELFDHTKKVIINRMMRENNKISRANFQKLIVSFVLLGIGVFCYFYLFFLKK